MYADDSRFHNASLHFSARLNISLASLIHPVHARWPRPAREPCWNIYNDRSSLQIKLLVVILVLQFYYLRLIMNSVLLFSRYKCIYN
jgi:hypothetical protein